MKNILTILFCLFSTISGLDLAKGHANEFFVEQKKTEEWADLDSIVSNALEAYYVPGAAVGIVKDNEVIFAKGYGFRNLEKKLPVTCETLFPIASCSKAFTTFVLGTLVDERAIQWDDPVIKHYPEFRLRDRQITHKMTIRDLLTHRSGLSSHDDLWYCSNLSRNEILNQLQYLEFASNFRQEFHYNNLMYVVAGKVIEKVTGQSWEKATEERLLRPLKMNQSNFSLEELKKNRNFSLPYAKTKKAKEIPFLKVSHIGPAGSINSNIFDMSKWVRLQLSNGTFSGKKFIQTATLDEMHTLQFPKGKYKDGKKTISGYGLGWFIGNYDGHYLLEHNGDIDGFATYIALFPEENIGLIILCNQDEGYHFINDLSQSIFDTNEFFKK